MLLSINNFPKFSLFFFKENIQKGKSLISFLWDKPLILCKNAAHTSLQWLSVQTHRYTVLYDNAVVLFSSLVIDDTQGLITSARHFHGR